VKPTLTPASAALPDVKVLRAIRHEDPRGWFTETWRRSWLDVDFVQENQALSRAPGTVRGLHFQAPPHAQAKLVRVLRGAVCMVALDLRAGPTFGRHARVHLGAGADQIFLPEGLAHGYCTLEPDTEVAYRVNRYWSPAHERGVRWDDATLNIEWPVSAADAVLADRDRGWPALAELGCPFP